MTSRPDPVTSAPARSAITVTTPQTIMARRERRDRVADDERRVPARPEHQPPREAGLEVGGDRESGEDAAEDSRLDQDEDVLEGRVAGVVEARRVRDRDEAARERGEEEDRHQHRRQEERRVAEHLVEQAPGDRPGRAGVANERRLSSHGIRHVRSIRVPSAAVAAQMPIARIATPTPKPSASASPSQPVISRLRYASMM